MKVEGEVITITKDELREWLSTWANMTLAAGRDVYNMDLPEFIEHVANRDEAR